MSGDMNREAFAVGWICALPETELAAAVAILDEEYDDVDIDSEDDNLYTFGRIGPHKIVIACLPAGRYGTVSAAGVAKDMLRSFPSIQLRLMVGIGGGLPNPEKDIRLGDVVVGQPTKGHAGVIRYDSGKSFDDGKFERRGHLNAPPAKLLNAISKLKGRHIRKEPEFPGLLARMLLDNPRMVKSFARPSSEYDVLSPGVAKRLNPQSDGKDVQRQSRDFPVPFYGLIASGDRVIASIDEANHIEKLIGEDRILCFDMEAAGLMNDFHCVVIRGISDYADSLKNDIWQPYAAAVAAAYAKELLLLMPPERSSKAKDDHALDSERSTRNHGVYQGNNTFGNTSATGSKVMQGNFNGVNIS